MSLVDRWLSRSPRGERVATPATSATSQKSSSISAGFSVATDLRHDATLPPSPIPSLPMSQPVADGLQHGNPQDAAALAPLSQMSLLSQDVAPDPSADAQEERAAIVEHDGGIPREWAEGFARLDPNRPPGDMPPRRWLRFIDDVGQFLDSPFCAVAVAPGWGPYDLFGADRDRPYARIDQAGLLWLLNGDRLVMLADDAARIETRTGVRHTFRRHPDEAGRMLAWEAAS
jgi:hypothetical protein